MGGERRAATSSRFGDTDDPQDFGPLTRRQAENLADFAIRRGQALGYEAIGRAVVAKILYLCGAAGVAIWLHLDDRAMSRLLDWMMK